MSEVKENTRTSVFTSIKSRNIAAVLMAFITCVVLIPGMTTYLPFNMADQIAVPILLFPFIWTALCLYSYMAEKAWQPWALMLLLCISHGTLSYIALTN
jgi:heme/copper-type cytochrome/quinol oxidase subunit 4|tara:strand:- start:23 stop:319 length:297 start_codon:yes stop_codon:yes gene_type:complete